MDQQNKTAYKTRAERQMAVRILTFAAVMLLLFAVGLLLFCRPAVSKSEKRELTPFPDFSWETLLSGEYFNQIDTWYADTYPAREWLMGICRSVRRCFGISRI